MKHIFEKIQTRFHIGKSGIIKASVLSGILILYLIFTQITSLYIPCIFRTVTGLCCPGCGISHFFTDLIHFNLSSAVQQNLAVAVLLPLWIAVLTVRLIFNPKFLNKRTTDILIWLSVIVLVIFGAMRNLPGLNGCYRFT